MMTEPKQNSNNPWLRPAMIFLARISGYIGASVVIGFFGGRFLDTLIHTHPYGMIIGVIIGFSVSVFGILKEIKVYEKSI